MTTNTADLAEELATQIDAKAEYEAFFAWSKRWKPPAGLEVTSHAFDAWLASARHRLASLNQPDGFAAGREAFLTCVKIEANRWPENGDVQEAMITLLRRMESIQAIPTPAPVTPAPEAGLREALRSIAETRWDTGALDACLTAVQTIAREALRATQASQAAMIEKLRTNVFQVLRRHDVSEQCFAEVAIVTQAALADARRELG